MLKPADEAKPTPAKSWLTIAVVLAVALVYSVISLRRGAVLSADSARYSQWADLLIGAHFNYVSWSSAANGGVVPPLAYAGWVTIVALSKLILGPAWATGILILNLVLAVAVVAMVLRLVGRVTSSPLMVAAAAVAFLVAFELWLWIPYALSDVSFMFLALTVLYLLCTDEGRGFRRLVPVALALLALVYRPAGLPLLLLVVVATLFGPRLQSLGVDARAAIARWSALSLCLLIAVAVVLDAALMTSPGSWPFPIMSSWVQELSKEYGQGVVIYGRPDTYHASSSGLLAFVWLNIDRLRWFFAFSAGGFSRGHVLANAAFFIPVYLGWFAALVSLMRPRSGLTWGAWWTVAVGTLFVVFFWVFHSLQYIDYDWRYRLPCVPVLIMLGAIGWQRIIREVSLMRRGTFARVGSTSTATPGGLD